MLKNFGWFQMYIIAFNFAIKFNIFIKFYSI